MEKEYIYDKQQTEKDLYYDGNYNNLFNHFDTSNQSVLKAVSDNDGSLIGRLVGSMRHDTTLKTRLHIAKFDYFERRKIYIAELTSFEVRTAPESLPPLVVS